MKAEPDWWENRRNCEIYRKNGGIGTTAAADKDVPAALFLTEESNRGGESRIGLRRFGRSPADELPESSSSVGGSSENEEEEEEDDAVSSQGRWIGSFSSSLEDSLPLKRGLSNHYIGKSKSFGNLMEASNAKELEKVESPLNKRRRLIIANKLRRRSSLSSFSITKINPNSMPLLALQESDDEDHKYNDDNSNDDDDDDDSSDDEASKMQEKRMKMTNNNNNSRDFMVQTQSCICLTSFQDDDR